MKSYKVLPEGYREILKIDLQKDKKLMLIVNLLGLIPAVIMVALLVPIMQWILVEKRTEMAYGLPEILVLLGGMVAYVILHELTHAVFMRRYCPAKVKFGFTGMYAYAGSAGYYCRKHYITIALAPVVIWGLVLLAMNLVLPLNWFVPVYLIQLMNLSGACGDLYVSWRFSKLPKDILVQDSGIAMTVYSREN